MTMRTKPGAPKRYEKVAFWPRIGDFWGFQPYVFRGCFQVMKWQTLGPWDDPFWKFPPPFVWNQPKPNLHHLLFVWKEWEGIFPFVVFGKEDLFSHSFIWGRGFQTFFLFFLFFWGLMKMRVVMVLMTRCFLLYSDRSYSDLSWYKISWTTFYTLQSNALIYIQYIYIDNIIYTHKVSLNKNTYIIHQTADFWTGFRSGLGKDFEHELRPDPVLFGEGWKDFSPIVQVKMPWILGDFRGFFPQYLTTKQ